MEVKSPQLIPAWNLLQAAGRPHSVIRVRNLQTSLIVGTDAWGREGKNQPVLISASASLRNPFESASSEDAVTGSTIHYGAMSKAILNACKLFSLDSAKEANWLSDLVDSIHFGLIKNAFTVTDGSSEHAQAAASSIMSLLEIKVLLPKASLLGSGVSLTKYLLFEYDQETAISESWIMALHDLKIPTLIGVNPNERLAKQLVVATVKIDGIKSGPAAHFYNALEEVVVKTIEESSFQTLEALAMHVGQRITKYYLVPYSKPSSSKAPAQKGYEITISLEKPTAVTFADAPVVEMTLDSDPDKNPKMRALWACATTIKPPPFPLQGRLDEWIASNRDLN